MGGRTVPALLVKPGSQVAHWQLAAWSNAWQPAVLGHALHCRRGMEGEGGGSHAGLLRLRLRHGCCSGEKKKRQGEDSTAGAALTALPTSCVSGLHFAQTVGSVAHSTQLVTVTVQSGGFTGSTHTLLTTTRLPLHRTHCVTSVPHWAQLATALGPDRQLSVPGVGHCGGEERRAEGKCRGSAAAVGKGRQARSGGGRVHAVSGQATAEGAAGQVWQ